MKRWICCWRIGLEQVLALPPALAVGVLTPLKPGLEVQCQEPDVYFFSAFWTGVVMH